MSTNALSTKFANTYHQALVVRTVQETPTVTTIYFTVNGEVLPFVAGQYISVYFENEGAQAGKAYSLSSAPNDPMMSITVKNIGAFSDRICSLKPNDSMQISSPFGFFNTEDQAPIIAIAAGVGIAPIWSLVRDVLQKETPPPISLYVSAPLESELVFREQLDVLVDKYSTVDAQYYVTREKTSNPSIENRRFSVAQDLPTDSPTSRYYICGSEQFVRSIWLQLMEAGVHETSIVTETFFEASI